MSEILKRIREDLKSAMTIEVQYRKHTSDPRGIVYEAVIAQKTVSRAIISMFPEIGKKPAQATDDDTIKLLKKYIGQEKERQLYIDKHITEEDVKGIKSAELKKLIAIKYQEIGDKLLTPEILIAQKYLPKEATKEEITSWISENIDFTKFKNKMQAMGPIMKQFQGCGGNFVKDILLNL